jgi:hypothetical protein
MPSTIRTYGNLTGTVYCETATYPVSCANRTLSPWTLLVTSTPAFGLKKTVWSETTPGFYRMKKRGELIPSHPFESTQTSRVNTGYSQFYTENVATSCSGPTLLGQSHYRGQYWGFVVANFSLDGVDQTTRPSQVARDNLLRQVATQVRADRQKGKANLVESLAESRQAYALFRHPLVNVVKFLDDFIRHRNYIKLQEMKRKFRSSQRKTVEGRVAYYAKQGKAGVILSTLLASEWLRFRYGITPLMKDIQALMEALKHGYEAAPTVHRTLVTKSIVRQSVSQRSLVAGSYEYFYTHAQTSEFSIRGFSRDLYKRDAFDELGLTLHNIIGVGWELTHLSFVVDWFVNVGDLLYANIPRVSLTPINAGYFTVDKVTVVNSPTSFVSLAPSVVTTHGGPTDIVVYNYTNKTRGIRLPNASLVINSDFGFDGLNRVLDSAALVVQRLRGLSF